jgi:alkanesulfonate monooxygenase SsuD/methylene tetrahydromethanopterin reductase-like flavin-dependent oxidoreductase (luciferase family)
VGAVPSRRDHPGGRGLGPPRRRCSPGGRDPAEIRRVLNVNGQITDGGRDGLLRGPVDQWVDELTDLAVAYGFDTFVFWGDGEDQLPRFAEEVMPAVRAQVAAERGRP